MLGRKFSVPFPTSLATNHLELIAEHLIQEYATPSNQPSYCRLGLELHEDSEPHLHGAFQFPKQRKIEDFAAFNRNVFGKHINVNRPTSKEDWEKWLNYCAKKGNFAELPYKLEITTKRTRKDMHKYFVQQALDGKQLTQLLDTETSLGRELAFNFN